MLMRMLLLKWATSFVGVWLLLQLRCADGCRDHVVIRGVVRELLDADLLELHLVGSDQEDVVKRSVVNVNRLVTEPLLEHVEELITSEELAGIEVTDQNLREPCPEVQLDLREDVVDLNRVHLLAPCSTKNTLVDAVGFAKAVTALHLDADTLEPVVL